MPEPEPRPEPQLPLDPEPAPPAPPRPRVLDLETSGEDVPPLLSQWEMLMPAGAARRELDAAQSGSPPEPSLELAAPWEYVGYEGDAAQDLQLPPSPPSPPPAPRAPPSSLSHEPGADEGPPDPETAAQIADAIANDELDWSSVIAPDAAGLQPESPAPETPKTAATPEEMADVLAEVERAMAGASQAAQISEALLDYCQRGFSRAFFFIIQYGVAMLWRGFGPGSDGAVMAFRPDLKEPSMFKAAVDTGKPSVVTVPETSTDEAFFWAISPPPPAYAVVVPVTVGGEARELLCVISDEPGPAPEVLGALERLSARAAEAHARLSGRS